jgi:CHASE2 domain-containing sensor protein
MLIRAERAILSDDLDFSFLHFCRILSQNVRRVVKGSIFSRKNVLKSAAGAVLAVLCGLVLWVGSMGEPWVNASYDYLFRFDARTVTNKVTLILMDNAAFDRFHQAREQPWDRGLHAQLLNKLADDDCPLVVFDSFFRTQREPASDKALADAMRRLPNVVLMAEQAQMTRPGLTGAHPILPDEMFLDAAGRNWGVAWLDPDLDSIVRRQWPFPSPGIYPDLPWVSARLAGAHLSGHPQKRWLRYYGSEGAWTRMSYEFAITQPKNYFHDQIVFIGLQPKTTLPNDEADEFRTPYTRWTGESSGGVEIMATSFLNLLNADWLRRPDWWVETLILSLTGICLGGGLCRMRFLPALGCGIAIAAFVTAAAIGESFFSNYWFPWLVIVGGQLPIALVWAIAMTPLRFSAAGEAEKPPKIPGYKLFRPPFGEGSYGKVWLARNASKEWRAVKVVYLAKFGEHPAPYEREFKGISRYKSISDQHPGLLRVDFISEKLDSYFYYVMELGDSIELGWELEPAKYKPRDLINECARLRGRRLPIHECFRIGLALTDALQFLHQRDLIHRDLKPQNVIFVDGQPKMADLGLVSEIHPLEKTKSYVGTPGFLPPPPETPGTPQADIYALGMVLYVIGTGRNVALFPEIATTLLASEAPAEFMPLNAIILKACHPDPAQRYGTAAEMHLALQEVKQVLNRR